jgi:hypothetical protein
MMQRAATAPGGADNDNISIPHAAGVSISWPAVPGAVLLLAAIAGAFLVGLVAVGLLAPVFCGFDLLRRRLSRPHRRGALLPAK